MKQENSWKIDVAVLCIFFARPEQFRQSFAEVKKARPRRLLLWQDGPRPGREDDVRNIELCRAIAEDIDWDCEVHRAYHSENMGCDPSTFNAQQWAFTLVDKCIILEDDLVPSPSFFLFCKEMLDRYEHDPRINRICGANMLGTYAETPYDYLFSKTGHSHGWATWRRVAETWNRHYEFLEDDYTVRLLREHGISVKQQDDFLNQCRHYQRQGVPYWEKIIGAGALLQSGLIIYPRVNMIRNVGFDENSTHTVGNPEALPKDIQKIYANRAQDLEFPLQAPPYVMEDRIFDRMCLEVACPSNPLKRWRRRIDSIYRKLRTGTFMEAVKRHMNNKSA